MAIKIAGTEVISDDKRILNNESLPDIRPSLLLDFANSKTLDPRITFTRGSTATYYDGKTTTKAEENLLRHSQDWTNSAWGGTATTITGDNTTAPDGTTTADRMNITSSNNYAGTAQRVTASPSTVYTASMYFKKANYDYMNFAMQAITSGGSYITNFATIKIDLSDGSENGSGTGTVSITSVGNGWYRVVVSGTTPSNTGKINVRTEFTDSSGQAAPSPSVAIGSQVYLWGAQLEQRSSATAYTPTTSSPIVKYQPVLQTAASGEARFDHDPVTGESKGLLIEEARTNRLTYSEAFDNAVWAKGNVSVLANTAISPDGTLTADKVFKNNTTSQASIRHFSFSNSPVGATTYSFYAKAAEYDTVSFTLYNPTDGHVANGSANLTNGTVNTTDGTIGIENAGNGWWRISGSGTNTVTTGNGLYIYPKDSTSYQGNGYSGVFLWGAQLEAGSFPTSYVPTSSSTVTRAKDVAQVTGDNFSQWFNPTEGTVLTDFDYNYNESGTGYPRIWSITEDGNIQNRMGILINETANGLTQELYSFNTGQVSIAYQLSNLTGSATAKSSFAYAEDNFGVSADGSLGTDTSGTVATASPRSILTLGGLSSGGGDHRQAWIKKWAYYPKRLPNTTLQALTEA